MNPSPSSTQSPAPAPKAGEATEVRFPEGFVWGAATASFQVEGSTTADGRGTSIWDTFSATPGKVIGGDTGEPGTDHYRRYVEDVALMRELGLGAYRFSVAWPRIQPDGKGGINRAGLDFYDRLVDELLAAGIDPWPTLYHWDLPQQLEDDGGWPVRDTALRFAEYAAVVHGTLGDRVTNWNTLNEPWCASFLGYGEGVHAPGRTDPAAALAAAHHLLLGHGLAVAAIREQAGQFDRVPRLGLAHNQTVMWPDTDSPADQAAARFADGLRNRIFTDPLFHGAYPEDIVEGLASITDFGFVRDGDLAVISTPLDMLGINFYNPQWVSGDPARVDPATLDDGDNAMRLGDVPMAFVRRGLPTTAMGWEIEPEGLYAVMTRLAAEAPGVDLYVCENGAAFEDVITEDGGVHDHERTAYIDAHLREVHRAIEAGVPMRGYFVWSLMDNFEWAWGYSKRFGIVHVDYETQRRTLKDSALWYSDVIRRGGLLRES